MLLIRIFISRNQYPIGDLIICFDHNSIAYVDPDFSITGVISHSNLPIPIITSIFIMLY